jgi:hypothetical protein
VSDSGQGETRGRETVLTRLLGPSGHELGCEECFIELDRYVELDVASLDPDRHVPGMRAHLEGCPACAEDFHSLKALLESEPRRA